MKLIQRMFLLTVAALLINISANADEGMWLLNKLKQINEADMQSKGLKLTADDIYNINNASLKDAIVQLGNWSGNSFGGFCTAELISDKGLLITNHHCGFDAIQNHSTVEHNYLDDGFWAKSMSEELPNEGLGVRFLVKVEDVTAEVAKQLSDTMSEQTRNTTLSKIYKDLVKKNTEGTPFTAEVRPFYYGSEFYLFVYQVYKDVRLVGTPPKSIGNYGGDTDNWMWPRHTGDFSIFRIYADKDNNPAPYSKENVPYKPKRFLTISLDGINSEDFTMIMGFPGRTDRYAVSESVKMALDQTNKAIVDIRTAKLDVIRADMKADPKIRIMYAAKHNNTSNYWKYFIGQSEQLKRNRVVDSKVELETKFTQWVNADAGRKSKYGNVLGDLKKDYDEMRQYNIMRTYLREAIMRGPEILAYASGFDLLEKQLSDKNTKPEDLNKTIEELKANVDEHFKEINQATDKKLFASLIKLYHDNVPAAQQPAIIGEELSECKGSYDKWAEEIFSESIFASKENTMAFLNKPSYKKLKDDGAYEVAIAIQNEYNSKYRTPIMAIESRINKNLRLWVMGIREMENNKHFYPDANSTMRFTYGSVKDYYPADAVYYNYYTTLDGVMQKMDNSNPEFVVPQKLVELYNAKDFGRYAVKGTVPACFISTNDITGGNSGSGILNANGELIGLAFDGNWEAMSGDIYYDPKLKRCINVDIRYVLFIVEKLGGANNLISEMKIVGNQAASMK